MFSELVKTVKVQLYERVTSPLLAAFFISWCLWNYRFLLVLADKSKIENKFLIIDTVLYPSWSQYLYINFLGPLLTALGMLYIYPLPARKVFEYNRKQQLKLRIIQQEIEDETPMTLEEGRVIRQEALKLELEFHSQLKKKDEEITDLKTMLIKLTEQATEISNTLVAEATNENINVGDPLPNGHDLPDVTDHELLAPTVTPSAIINNTSVEVVEQGQKDEQLPLPPRTLFFNEFWKLDDHALNKEAELIINEIQESTSHNATELLTVIQRLFFLSSEGIIKITTNELKDIFLRVITEIFAKGGLNFDQFYFSSRLQVVNDVNNEDYKSVKEKLMNYKEVAYEMAESKEINDLFSLLDNDEVGFLKSLYSSPKFDTVPLFKYIPIDDVFKTIVNSTPDTILKLAEFLNHRYRAVNIREFLSEDAQPLYELLLLLNETSIQNKYTGTKGYAIKSLIKALEGISPRLSPDRAATELISAAGDNVQGEQNDGQHVNDAEVSQSK